MKFEITETESAIISQVERVGKRIWIVGGAIRDCLSGRKPKDLDLATNWDHQALAALIRQMGLVVIPDQTAFQHGIIRVVDRDTGNIIDIARLRKDISTDGRHATVEFTDILEEDLARRDFTFNAMACEVNDKGYVRNFIDPFNGENDLNSRIIQFVGDPEKRIQEDYLRMVRFCRFTALDFNYYKNGIEACKKYAENINQISQERIRDEVLKALNYPTPSNFFRNLHDCGLLVHILPELAKGIGVDQNEFHSETVFEHLMRCVDASVGLTDNVMLKLATLLHDVGKPKTKSTDEDGRVHFYKHEVEGASIAYEWMQEYKFAKKDVDYVVKLVRHHQFRFDDDTKDSTIRKWLQETGKDVWRDLITLRCADRKGNLAKQDRPMITEKMRELMKKAQELIDSGDAIFKEDLAIDGHDLQALGVKPGKIYKEIFQNLLGIVINNPEKNNKDWISNWVKNNYTNVNK